MDYFFYIDPAWEAEKLPPSTSLFFFVYLSCLYPHPTVSNPDIESQHGLLGNI